MRRFGLASTHIEALGGADLVLRAMAADRLRSHGLALERDLLELLIIFSVAFNLLIYLDVEFRNRLKLRHGDLWMLLLLNVGLNLWNLLAFIK